MEEIEEDNIFTVDDTNIKDLPRIRNIEKLDQDKKIEIPFTKKSHPGLPARESRLKEPPIPRGCIKSSSDDKDLLIEEKDPAWLKDKISQFITDENWESANMACQQALLRATESGNILRLRIMSDRILIFIKMSLLDTSFYNIEKLLEEIE